MPVARQHSNPAHSSGRAVAGAVMLLAAFLLLLLFAQQATAEGRGGLDTTIDQRGWMEFWDRATNTRYPRHDKNFIAGKKIYLGQNRKQRVRFCLASDADAPRVPLTRKSLAAYRNMPVVDFVKSLYDCDNPGQHALKKMPPEDAGLVVYYLARQYKLRLQQDESAATAAR